MKLPRHLGLPVLALLALLPQSCGEQNAQQAAAQPLQEKAQAPTPPRAEEPAAQRVESTENLADSAAEDTAANTLENADNGESAEEEADGEPQAPTDQAADPHPIFTHWHEVLMAQSTPEEVCHITEGQEVTDEDREEADEVRGKALMALEAARELYLARMAIVEGAISHPDFYEDDDKVVEALETYRAWLADGFRRDLEALGTCDGWLSEGCVEPSLRPGRQELLLRPLQESLSYSQVDGGTHDIEIGICGLNSAWEQRQDAFMDALRARYDESYPGVTEGHGQDPISGMCWHTKDGKLPQHTLRNMADMQAILHREAQAWRRYKDAMCELVSPSRGYRGSGMGILASEYESHLLDTRERFICLLTVSVYKMADFGPLEADSNAELQTVNTAYAYGEIFSDEATLFRHPRLEGNPWCIRFHRRGAGFIFVPGCEALETYIADHPQGGSVHVKGYQTIESVGNPYAVSEDDPDAELPADAMKLRQVFRMLDCVPEEEYDPDAEWKKYTEDIEAEEDAEEEIGDM